MEGNQKNYCYINKKYLLYRYAFHIAVWGEITASRLTRLTAEPSHRTKSSASNTECIIKLYVLSKSSNLQIHCSYVLISENLIVLVEFSLWLLLWYIRRQLHVKIRCPKDKVRAPNQHDQHYDSARDADSKKHRNRHANRIRSTRVLPVARRSIRRGGLTRIICKAAKRKEWGQQPKKVDSFLFEFTIARARRTTRNRSACRRDTMTAIAQNTKTNSRSAAAHRMCCFRRSTSCLKRSSELPKSESELPLVFFFFFLSPNSNG